MPTVDPNTGEPTNFEPDPEGEARDFQAPEEGPITISPHGRLGGEKPAPGDNPG
jgi:hypothetical protein